MVELTKAGKKKLLRGAALIVLARKIKKVAMKMKIKKKIRKVRRKVRRKRR